MSDQFQAADLARAGTPHMSEAHRSNLNDYAKQRGLLSQAEIVAQRVRDQGRDLAGIKEHKIDPKGPLSAVADVNHPEYGDLLFGCIQEQMKQHRHLVRVTVKKDDRFDKDEFREQYARKESITVGPSIFNSFQRVAARFADLMVKPHVIGCDIDNTGRLVTYYVQGELPALPKVKIPRSEATQAQLEEWDSQKENRADEAALAALESEVFTEKQGKGKGKDKRKQGDSGDKAASDLEPKVAPSEVSAEASPAMGEAEAAEKADPMIEVTAVVQPSMYLYYRPLT